MDRGTLRFSELPSVRTRHKCEIFMIKIYRLELLSDPFAGHICLKKYDIYYFQIVSLNLLLQECVSFSGPELFSQMKYIISFS